MAVNEVWAVVTSVVGFALLCAIIIAFGKLCVDVRLLVSIQKSHLQLLQRIAARLDSADPSEQK